MYKLAVALLLVCSTLCHASPIDEKTIPNGSASQKTPNSPVENSSLNSVIDTSTVKESAPVTPSKPSETNHNSVPPNSSAANKDHVADHSSGPDPLVTTTKGTTTSSTTTTVKPLTSSSTTTSEKPSPSPTPKPTPSPSPSPSPPSPTTKPPPPSTSTLIPSTTAHPTPSPSSGGFNLISFLGGMILGLGLLAIGYVVFKFYQTRRDSSYRTL